MRINYEGYKLSGLMAALGLVTLVVGAVVMLALPDVRFVAWIILALGGLLLVIAFILDFRRVRGAVASRRGRFGIGTMVMTSFFVGIIIVVNVISINNYQRFDTTSLGQFTLTSSTEAVLAGLETPVQALCFFVPGDVYGEGALSLLDEYQNHTDKLSVDTIDPDKHPDQAREYDISQYPTIVFEGQSGYRLVRSWDIAGGAEHAFTSALLEVTGTVQKKVYFLTGHSEASIASSYTYASDGLRDTLFLVETLNLSQVSGVPEDCAALIIAGPCSPLADNEMAAINSYLDNGGRALILLDPGFPDNVGELVSQWDINVKRGTVVDPSSSLAGSTDTPIVTPDRNATALLTIYFPGATALEREDEIASNIELAPVAWTTDDGWLESNFTPGEEPQFNEGVEEKGSLVIGAFVKVAPEGKTVDEVPEAELARIVVIGDSDFAANSHFLNVNNSSFFVGWVNWLTLGTEIVSIDRRVMPFRELVVNQDVKNFIQYSSILLIPALVLIGGGIVWWRRR